LIAGKPTGLILTAGIANLETLKLLVRLGASMTRSPSPRIWQFMLVLSLALSASSCNGFHRQARNQSDHYKLASHLQDAVAEAGGAQIWIKHALRLRHGQSSGLTLQVVASPAGYAAVLSRLKQEATKNNLDLRTSSADSAPGVRVANVSVTERGQRIIQIRMQEVTRLLRAAIVIDDMGQDLNAAHKLLALDAPVAFSVLPHLRYTNTTAQEVHRSGQEVMLHLPMEPEPSAHISPGEGAVLVGMKAAEVRRIVESDLDSVPFAAGVNNHMGSRATQDSRLMAAVMQTLSEHRLYFIDSRTTAGSMALEAARRQGLPAFYRAVFLDDTETIPYTLSQLREFRRKIEQDGTALAIGHPHPTTIAALATFLPELEKADIQLVAPSQIVRLPELANLHPPAARNEPQVK
jgi:polysaccharide deacetylase 2 family uncharacterized protein YibQ